MKSFIQTFLFLFLGIPFAHAQDTLVILSTKMFNVHQLIKISPMKGWLFKSGNDLSWANKDIDVRTWQRMNPMELSARFADKVGKVEGWFRLKFQLDSSFRGIPVGVRRGAWAATDVYMDGDLLASFGKTGYDGKPYEEYNPIDKQSALTNVGAGQEHLLAVHVVDYLSPIPPRQLKSETIGGTRQETMGFEYFIMLAGPKYDLFTLKASRLTLLYRSIWVSVTALLAVLFWLLVFQNPKEKRTLLMIAVYASFSAVSNLARFPLTNTNISFVAHTTNDLLQKFSSWVILVTTFMIITTILNFTLFKNIRRLLIAYSVLATFTIFFNFFGPFLLANLFFAVFSFTYMLVSSWKKLKGAQWAIVGGLLLSIVFVAILVTVPLDRFALRLYLLSCFYFSFPLSLVAYVSLRFREIIREVEETATQVVQMTKEREEQAVKQQQVLEEEVKKQTAELRSTLDNLRSTQAQLLQSEKMASLGQLTAGIAHEIQNPLNFVNNFSEVNRELIEEVKSLRKESFGQNSKLKSEELDELLNDIADNEEKINHHGKRADAIVKGMLQHSRTSSGQTEPTDINALCDEYFRLSYHGLRAKDKSFNAKFETDFDPSLPKLNVVPQEIGRVILNLINNAFYAVSEKQKQNILGYEPTVTATTKRNDGQVLLSVADNGNGISQKIFDKIFQPFFTTKPTGQGTGLGLSLAYDIVKAHGGEIKVETKDGEGSEFIVELPIKPN